MQLNPHSNESMEYSIQAGQHILDICYNEEENPRQSNNLYNRFFICRDLA